MRYRISKNLLALSAGLVVAGVFALPNNDALAGHKNGYENICLSRVKAKAVVKGYGPDFVLRKKAKRRAIGYWRDKVGNIHGARFDTWRNSTDRKVRCKTVYNGVKCVAKARPCGVVRHTNRYDSGEYYGTGYDSDEYDYYDEPVGGQIIIYGGGNYDDDYADRRRYRKKAKQRHKKRNFKRAKRNNRANRKYRAKRSSRYNTPSGIIKSTQAESARRRQERSDNAR